MRLPALLYRRKPHVYKNTFGHCLILAGSKRMLGAAALTGLAAMRSGAGLVTLGVPEGLNSTVQKKIANVIMTWPLPQTTDQTISLFAFNEIKKQYTNYAAIAIGPGLSFQANTKKFILKIISTSTQPLVIDADGINALKNNLHILKKTETPKILTPHPGEMARMLEESKSMVEKNRKKIASEFARKYHCTLLIKGNQTVVAAQDGKVYVNKTGNPGMATAGSGDVLTGMITAFLGQGLNSFAACKYAVFLHGKAGDLAAQQKTRLALMASDIIDHIPSALKSEGAK